MAQKRPQSSTNQADKFKEAAREVGADESDEAFAKKLKKLAKVKPKRSSRDSRDS